MRHRNIAVRLLCILIFFAMLSACAIPFLISAQASDTPSLAGAKAVSFIHVESETTVLSKDADTRYPAGSAVKVLSGLLLCRELEGRLSEHVTITADMLTVPQGYRKFGIQEGDVIPVEQLLYTALCGSYNDAFVVLACYAFGSEDNLVDHMNQQAASIGAKNSLFSDSTGILDVSYTTASDLGKIALAAYQNELYMEITSTQRYHFAETVKQDAKTFYNRNELIASSETTKYYNSKCMGMSAGSTTAAGHCVVTAVSDKKSNFLCVVMGGEKTDEENYAYAITNSLIRWVYQTYAQTEVISPDAVICTVPVRVSDMTSEIELRVKESRSYLLPTDAKLGKDITYSVRLLSPSLEAPVTEDMMVGYVAIIYREKTLDTLPLYTAGSAQRSSFINSIESLKAMTESRVFRAGILFFLVSFSAWMIAEAVIARKRKHKWDKYFSEKLSPPPTVSAKKRKD